MPSSRREGLRGPTTAPAGLDPTSYALLFAAALGLALIVYGPALSGPFVSDDLHYVAANPYVHSLNTENIWTILQPHGAATVAVVNYSPVPLLLHAAVWELVGDRVTTHHLLNLVLHVVASLLLVALLIRSRLPRSAAVVAGGAFLLHPANVEAVAWISQLKSSSAMVLMLAALLAQPGRPVLAALLYGTALLAKASAAVALPVALVLEWARAPQQSRGEHRLRWPWLAVWLVIFTGYALIEFSAHQRAGAAETTLHQTPAVLLRTVASLSLRYLLMAATSRGVSTFHEPEPASSPFDPWWLASLPVLGLLGWRLFAVLRARREESAYWVWALGAFAPVSQIFPFLYPLADRYLYFMLPGLLGGTLLAGRDLAARLPQRRRALLGRFALVLGLALCAGFGLRSHERAGIWRSPALLVADAARHYPDGVSASLLRAQSAARTGDVAGAVAAIRAAMERGYNRYEQLLADPAFRGIRDSPAFVAIIHEIAGGWIESGRDWQDPTQMELRKLASAHAARGEREAAVELLRRALSVGGPLDAEIRRDLAQLGARP